MPKPLLFQNARIITPNITYERGWLLTRDGKIAAFAPYNAPNFDDVEVINGEGLTLLPGFIDIHTHGGNGYDVMDGDVGSLEGMAQFYAISGVTSFLATTWTDTGKNIFKALSAIKEAQGAQAYGATLLGAHLEGPYLNTDRCGAQHAQYIRRALKKEAQQFLDLDIIRLLALAPEFAQNHWLITESVKRGITVSTAHTNAKYDDIRYATTLGISHATHIFNAMTPLHHRDPGVVGAVLSLDQINCELICDLVHVHPAAINIVWRSKGKDRVILITDSVKLAGMPDGNYHFSHHDVEMIDGTIRILANDTLVGTTLAMNSALRNFMTATGEPLENVWQTASWNPARAINVSTKKGSITIGKDADLILVDDEINVYMTVVEGRIVYHYKAD